MFVHVNRDVGRYVSRRRGIEVNMFSYGPAGGEHCYRAVAASRSVGLGKSVVLEHNSFI
jgi:hypothetical protein